MILVVRTHYTCRLQASDVSLNTVDDLIGES